MRRITCSQMRGINWAKNLLFFSYFVLITSQLHLSNKNEVWRLYISSLNYFLISRLLCIFYLLTSFCVSAPFLLLPSFTSLFLLHPICSSVFLNNLLIDAYRFIFLSLLLILVFSIIQSSFEVFPCLLKLEGQYYTSKYKTLSVFVL